MEHNWYSHCGNQCGGESRNRITLWSSCPLPACILKSALQRHWYVHIYNCVTQSSCGQSRASQLRGQDIICIYVSSVSCSHSGASEHLWSLQSRQAVLTGQFLIREAAALLTVPCSRQPGTKEGSGNCLSYAQVSFSIVCMFICCVHIRAWANAHKGQMCQIACSWSYR